ncbi:hypothetical protein D1007_25407 [Hordeum vulgare]|nr:hypothetical protein D1007_25407 [Hordeum vulgare]
MPEHPPGFEGCEGHHVQQVQATIQPVVLAAPIDYDPLFRPVQQPLLTLPVATPPARLARRHKTMAGVDIIRDGVDGLSLTCRSASLRACVRSKGVSAAKAGELLVCRNLGIVQDGEDITDRALDELAARFKEQLSMDVMAALPTLFKVDDGNAREMEDALLMHAGSSVLDREVAPTGVGAMATC